MGKWRDAFEQCRPSELDTLFNVEYKFGSPASEQQLATAEATLGVKLPRDVRELLSEFNGIWYATEEVRREDLEPEIYYLDTHYMSIVVPDYFRTSGNPLPAEEVLSKVVFIRQSNGFGDLWGVCVEDVAGFRKAQVVKLDHEIGELEECASSLFEFVRDNK